MTTNVTEMSVLKKGRKFFKQKKNRVEHLLYNYFNRFMFSMYSMLNIADEVRFNYLLPETARAVIWVPLSEVKRFIPNRELEKIFKPNKVHFSTIPSFIWDGDWDLKSLSIDDYYTDYNINYRSMMQILNDEINYRKTDEYQKKVQLINTTGQTSRGNNFAELDAYFESLIKLAADIKENGYKLQKYLNNDPHDEIGVFIGRNGEIIKAEDKFCGTHRFAIAKYLKLEQVPVCVLAVHKIWAKQHINLITRSDDLQNYFFETANSQ